MSLTSDFNIVDYKTTHLLTQAIPNYETTELMEPPIYQMTQPFIHLT